MDKQNQKISLLLNKRQKGFLDFRSATQELFDMGVQFKEGEGAVNFPDRFKNHLDKLNKSLLEFEWEVEYQNGKTLKQFEEENQHNFKHIDKSQIKQVRLVSNFDWPTDMEEKRVIVTLDWETGLFDFLNGIASQEVKSECCVEKVEGEKKLILFKRVRVDSGFNTSGDENAKGLVGDTFTYNRFALGFEADGKKRVIIIDPTGCINLLN